MSPASGRELLPRCQNRTGRSSEFLINAFGLHYSEVTSANLVRVDIGPDIPTAFYRLWTMQRASRLEAALKAQVAQRRVPDTEATVAINVGRPPFAGDARTQALARRAQAIYAELDNRPLTLVPGTGGGTDAGFANRSGKPAVLESLGLAGWGYHAKDEYIEIDSIVPRLYLSARLLMDLGRD